jgi:formylglycine-generating enzyme required for sulfatase activity
LFTACGTTGERRNGAVHNPDGIELVYVEGTDIGDTSIEGFYIGKFEVTQNQWKKIMDNNPSDFKGDNLPVENVSWNDVQEFLTRLNSATGRNYRLPTDVEWEFAARGGTAEKSCPDGCEYSGGNELDKIAWYKSNSGERTQPVGMKAPNELGIHDMTGNVWEWCGNVFIFNRPQGGAGSPQSGVDAPPPVERRAVRGGSWGSEVPRRLQVSFRTGDAPDYKSHYIGFRVVLP